jgi:hypothetical protein
MQFQPGDHVKITNPHPENAKWRGKTGTINRIGQDGMHELRGVNGRISEKVLGVIACTADELTRA